MQNPRNLLKRFLREEEGPTAAEYAVLIALLVVLCVLLIRAIGDVGSDAPDSTAISTSQK